MRRRRARSRGDNVARSALLIRGLLLIVSIISVFKEVLGHVKVSHHLSSVRAGHKKKLRYGIPTLRPVARAERYNFQQCLHQIGGKWTVGEASRLERKVLALVRVNFTIQNRRRGRGT